MTYSHSKPENNTLINGLSLKAAAAEYQKRGFVITPLRPKSKAAYEAGWNTPGYACHPEHWEYFPGDNIGMILEPSGVCVVDIDNKDEFLLALETVRPQLPAAGENPFWKTSTAGIRSGKPNKGKLVFLAPDGVKLTYRKLLWNTLSSDGVKKHTVFELRCGYLQDVLPPSIHPDTGGPYQWVGEDLLPLPFDLLALWYNWEMFEPTMLKADRLYSEAPPKLEKGRPRTTRPKGRDIIGEWNQQHELTDQLQKYGYRKIGDRFLSPSSTSGTAGVVISDDGMTFYAFNQSDVFADGHQHNAFDLMLHYEHRGNFRAAIEQAKDDLGVTRIRDSDLLETARKLFGVTKT